MREAWAGPAPGRELVSVGRFTNSASLSVIDLASLPAIPSIFDEGRRHLRPPLRFLHEFSNRISAPVRTAARSESEMVEYVPTQVVSEYFRTTFARDYGEMVIGLLFRSVANEGGICCALFVRWLPEVELADLAGAVERALKGPGRWREQLAHFAQVRRTG